MANNTPHHEPEVAEAIDQKLYTQIIDLLNAQSGISFGNKMFILAKVIDSARMSVKTVHPEMADNMPLRFMEMLVSLERQDP